MVLTTEKIDTLYSIYDLLDGACTLLLGLAEYDGVDKEVKAALHIVASELEMGRDGLDNVLSSVEECETG